MWAIWVIIFSATLLLMAMLLLKILFDFMAELRQAMLEVKTQVYLNRDTTNLLASRYIEMQDMLKDNGQKYRELEFQVMRPHEINLYTKEPIKVEAIKPSTARMARPQKKSEITIRSDLHYPDFPAKAHLTPEQSAALVKKIKSQMDGL